MAQTKDCVADKGGHIERYIYEMPVIRLEQRLDYAGIDQRGLVSRLAQLELPKLS